MVGDERVDVHEASWEEVEEITRSIRIIDVIEGYLQTGNPLYETLKTTYDLSPRVWVGYYDDELVNVFGVAVFNLFGGEGHPWMLATNKIDDCPIHFLRESCYYLNEMKQGFSRLHNYVYADHKASIGWLKWLGFKMHPAKPYGPFGANFHYFEWEEES